jgi:hypothetical protein
LSKQGAKGGKTTVGRRKACVYWRLRRSEFFGGQSSKLAESDKSVVRDAQSHIFVTLGLEDESRISASAGGELPILVVPQTFARKGSSHFQPAKQATE